MGLSWIEEKGKKILFVDYSNCKKPLEMLDLLYEYTDILKKSVNKINSIENYEGAYVNKEFMDIGNKLGKEIHTKKLEKNALLGITGVKKILLNVYIKFSRQNNLKCCQTKEEAISWILE